MVSYGLYHITAGVGVASERPGQIGVNLVTDPKSRLYGLLFERQLRTYFNDHAVSWASGAFRILWRVLSGFPALGHWGRSGPEPVFNVILSSQVGELFSRPF